MNLVPPPAYTPPRSSNMRTAPTIYSMNTSAASNTPPVTATAVAAAAAAIGEAQQAASTDAAVSRNMFVFQLLTLLAGTFAVKFMLSFVKLALDCLLYMLALSCVLAFIRPGPKDGPVLTVLGHIEAVVDPIYSLLADRVVLVAAGPFMAIGRYLKTAAASRNNTSGNSAAIGNASGPAPMR
ncbi:hypothetical protein LPJ53_004245 [Coemansia erecta]|uniref:Uncharacterized protein n=1 Tax=Coemansia erecta TaxID=147472 RepID=A0A9W8CQ09_9FUNG|nr:hypothetical protein LPJ53_004245 [Coemansia erecta]